MAETLSTMIPLGTQAPDFRLLDVRTNEARSLAELKSNKATVIMFLCNHCPYVKYIQPKLVELAKSFQIKGISFIGISSNDINTYPEDGPTYMRQEAEDNDYPFPYLFDETQEIAKAYHAACTPDFFVFDNQLRCIYRGRFDDATPGNRHEVTGKDLRHAIEQTLAGKLVSEDQKPSMGCNIKWKK